MNDPAGYEDFKAHMRLLLDEILPQLMQSMSWGHKPRQRILDYGCGPGTTCLRYYVPFAETWDAQIIGVDVSPEMVEYARSHSAHPRVQYRLASIFEPVASGALEPGSFDKIFCSLVFHFLKPHKAAIAQLATLLRPGGQIGFLNISASPHFHLLQLLAKDHKFAPYMRGCEGYIPTWIEEGKDFEEDLRADGALPPGLKIINMESHKRYFDIPLERLAGFLISVGPLGGKLPKDLAEELMGWYRKQLTANLETKAGGLVVHWNQLTIGVFEKES